MSILRWGAIEPPQVIDLTVSADVVVAVGDVPAPVLSSGTIVVAVAVDTTGDVPAVVTAAGFGSSPAVVTVVGDVPAVAVTTGAGSAGVAPSTVVATAAADIGASIIQDSQTHPALVPAAAGSDPGNAGPIIFVTPVTVTATADVPSGSSIISSANPGPDTVPAATAASPVDFVGDRDGHANPGSVDTAADQPLVSIQSSTSVDVNPAAVDTLTTVPFAATGGDGIMSPDPVLASTGVGSVTVTADTTVSPAQVDATTIVGFAQAFETVDAQVSANEVSSLASVPDPDFVGDRDVDMVPDTVEAFGFVIDIGEMISDATAEAELVKAFAHVGRARRRGPCRSRSGVGARDSSRSTVS